jgi:hypothetical protein
MARSSECTGLYAQKVLDTADIVREAMYRKMGFKEIPPYRPNPIAGAIYMELEL